MLNQFVVVGRLQEITKSTPENTNATITLQITSTEQQNVLLPITITPSMYDNIKNILEVGSLCGIKGRFSSEIDTTDTLNVQIVAEKITFLSSGK